MKPIEPGCLALVYGLVVDTQFNGMCVHVEKRVCHGERMLSATYGAGIYRGPGAWACSHSDWQGCEPFGSENLLRIDGGEDESLETEHDKELENA